ncbi:MAG: aspartate aminotransferase family protein [Dehalococcoidia bacterium]|nr:aspartate aminotransferase family protein [Dehalococcoidia bacterium]
MNWTEIEQKDYMQVFERLPVTLIKGRGMYVRDNKGKRYLDFVAGIAVVSLGHCHPVLVKAVNRQSHLLFHTSNLFYTTPQLKLAELLIKNSDMKRVFFANSGTEAVEGAVKLARRWGSINLNGAFEVISANNSFHGRTLAMIAATGQQKFQHPYEPLPAGFINVPYNDIDAIKAATTDKTCAVLIEAIQGEGGVNIPHPEYLKQVRAWCDEKNLLLILDEVQTGVGRCGTLFAYRQSGIIPDVVALAKGLAGGIPIGAVLATEKASVFVKGDHGTTFGGNALACAASHAVLSYIIKNDIPSHSLNMGTLMLDGLKKLKQEFPCIADVRGKGLLLAMQFENNLAKDTALACLDMGLLVNNLKPNLLRFIPPLIVQPKDINKALGILRKALQRVIEQCE